MAKYTYYACDLITGQQREELELTNVSAQRLLNDDGTFSATMPIAHLSSAQRRAVIDATEGGRSTIVVVRDGTPLGEWEVWQRPDRKNDGSEISLQGKYITSYFKKVIWQVQQYAATDQLQIAWDMVDAAAEPVTPWSVGPAVIVPAGSHGITLAMPTRASQVSGVIRQRTYDQTQYKMIGDFLDELMTVDDGFDFDIDITYDSSGNLQRVPGFFYPMRGIDTGVTFDQPSPGMLGGNTTDFSQSEDGTQIATVSVAVGAGQGVDSQVVAAAANTGLVLVFPVLHQVKSYSTVSELGTLQGHASADAAAAGSSRVPPTLTLLADEEPVIGATRCGDIVHMGIDPSTSFPDGVIEALRITGLTYTPPKTGPETYTANVALIG